MDIMSFARICHADERHRPIPDDDALKTLFYIHSGLFREAFSLQGEILEQTADSESES